MKNWLCLNQSRIPNSGLGVFARRDFLENDFVTAYLGIVERYNLEMEYVFQQINGKVDGEFSSLIEEFLFAHRLQHGSGPKANSKIKHNYALVTL